ncbi:MAG: RNHCP domain-containing protein [Candidatus Veblenbacteria bacterium]|nr:RNHCP domain-containing protein [Candidatus Veblenbacteria bacterium]
MSPTTSSMSKKFQKRVEDFTCEHCSVYVTGTGYTNHCPHCLWSKHVDVHPGDRNASCGGMMEPVGLVVKHSQRTIAHRCTRCGFEQPNRTASNDNRDTLVLLSARPHI